MRVGIVGGRLWIGLWHLRLEGRLRRPAVGPDYWLGPMPGLGTRSAFNPLDELADRPALAYGFLAVRFVGLVFVIAVAEECSCVVS